MSTAPDHSPKDLLLATKFYQPRLRSSLVARPHLTEQLRRGMEGKLILISAPAGFGKTTLLAQWLAESGTPAAWLSLEPEDNNLVRFLTYLIAAQQTIDASLGASAMALLQAPEPAPVETVMTLLSNDLARYTGQDFALALDDYHVISAESIHRAMSFLIDHLPTQMHLVLATRADPPLPLTRLRAGGQLAEVRAAELRFTTDEVEAFLRTVMQLQLVPEAAATLWGRTEGWVAGLQFAALSLQGRTDVAAFLSAFGGSHRFVLDYLSDEVLSRQSEAVQSFLLFTSILEHLSGPLCDAVTGQEGSQAVLESLDRANLFLVALDDERRWYRYHHLFAGVLRRKLQQEHPALVPELHRRASVWYLDVGAVREAIHHLLLAGEKERVADVIEEQGLAFGTGTGEHIQSLHGWLNLLPDEVVRARPILCLLHATTFMRTNQFEKAEARLQDAERCLDEQTPVEQARFIRGAVATMRANISGLNGDMTHTFVFAQQALDLLPETATYIRAIARTILAHAAHGDGDVSAAREQMAVEAVAFIRPTGNIAGTLNNLAALARLRFLQGKLRLAVATYEEARQLLAKQEGLEAPSDSVGYYFGLGDIHREWNHLDEAERLLLRCVEPIRGIFAVAHEVVTQGYVSLARLYMARGDYKQAIEVLDTFAQVTREQRFTSIQVAQGEATRAQVELARGQLAPAIHWAETSGLTAHDELSYPREMSYMILVRVLIAQSRVDPTGSYVKDALYVLDHIRADAEAKARMSSVLEVLVLQSLAFDVRSERQNALAALERALTLAAPERYVRIFVDEGEPMQTLLRLAQKHGITPGYTGALLAAFNGKASPGVPETSGALVEPLTEREREVLRLLYEGASNSEIASRLVVSVNTVKKHVFNICGKLGTQSRAQAIAKARMLNLV